MKNSYMLLFEKMILLIHKNVENLYVESFTKMCIKISIFLIFLS